MNGLWLGLGFYMGAGSGGGGGLSSTYIRFGGAFNFRRPDGTSLYLRP